MSKNRKMLGTLAIGVGALAAWIGGAAPAGAAPAAPDLHAKVATLLDPGAGTAARAAELADGGAGLATFDRAAALIAIAPASWRWDVVNVAYPSDDLVTAQLLTATDGYEPWYFDLAWTDADGSWKLTHDSACNIGNFVGTGC
ncbi:hypothetical protein [Nocardia stercoris]|uniref:Low molecular weight antigen MTB12-like C-terminal domain-containing protein n=1 Tax=Nocardia stercoris TaxID=2483361 RepID=A0A3M2KRU8_9NOCA|nr:hypothetical protein [Nocardia stercoris]RMI28377.1 hypothetical protein EBN03_30465 [Nocardia stercoris]